VRPFRHRFVECRNVRRTPLLIALLVLALAYPGFALADGGVAPPEPASPNAEAISHAWWLVLALCGIVFFAVFVPLGYFIWRFRSRGRGRTVEGPQIRGNTNLEIAWSVVPVVILAIMLSYVLVKLDGIRNVEAKASDTLVVEVEGRQYYWNYTYPDGTIAVDTLTIPVDKPVKLAITAARHDVIHSYWVPALQGKFDAIPGQVNTTTIRATRQGSFRGVCAELCGLQHAAMRFTVEVVSAAEFDAFLASNDRKSKLGEETWNGACAKCHGAKAEGDIGPKLAGNPQMSQRDALTTIVEEGRGAMPAVGKNWKKQQLDALLDYVGKTYAPKGSSGS
jgi:cytochrome c oxidase subunit 2